MIGWCQSHSSDCESRARRYGLGRMRWPDPWPSDGLPVARALIYAERQGELKRFALAAMRMGFLEGLDPGGDRDATGGGSSSGLVRGRHRRGHR
jgi:hypothetical protein